MKTINRVPQNWLCDYCINIVLVGFVVVAFFLHFSQYRHTLPLRERERERMGDLLHIPIRENIDFTSIIQTYRIINNGLNDSVEICSIERQMAIKWHGIEKQ